MPRRVLINIKLLMGNNEKEIREELALLKQEKLMGLQKVMNPYLMMWPRQMLQRL